MVVSTHGKTANEARNRLREALGMFGEMEIEVVEVFEK